MKLYADAEQSLILQTENLFILMAGIMCYCLLASLGQSVINPTSASSPSSLVIPLVYHESCMRAGDPMMDVTRVSITWSPGSSSFLHPLSQMSLEETSPLENRFLPG